MRHEIQGDVAQAVVHGNYPDEREMHQIYALLSAPPFKGASIRIMPDHHGGIGCVIGFTCPIDMNDPKVIPNVIGVDIGCGVQAVRLPQSINLSREEHFAAFDRHLRGNVPAGFSGRESVSDDLNMLYERFVSVDCPLTFAEWHETVEILARKVGADPKKVWRSCGSLGGGNHFIEIGQASTGSPESETPRWLIVHSGSRNFGLKVAAWHQRKAKTSHANGDLSWLEGDDAIDYLRDMRTCQRFAALSRSVMLHELLGAFKMRLHEKLDLERIVSVHNFISESDHVIRKGAISARTGEYCIVPYNMAAGVIIGRGKGNVDWNNSAPHGAGRRMGRGEAKSTLSMQEFKDTMREAGVWSSCVSHDTLDEAPAAYKPAIEIEQSIADTIDITARLKPVYNFKAGKE